MSDTASAGPLLLRSGNPMSKVLMALLIFQTLACGLAIPVMTQVSHVAVAVALAGAGGVGLLSLAGAGLLRRPVGYLLGWLAQPATLALGLLTTGMWAVGAIFASLWVLTFVLGRRLDAAPRPSTGSGNEG